MRLSFYKFAMFIIAIFFIGYAHAQHVPKSTVQNQLASLELSSGGRLGVSAINTANNMRIQYHANQRFPTGCTSKVIGVAAILKRSMTDNSLLQKKIFYNKNDLTNWTPITAQHIAEGMTIEDLSMAAISYSDNTAMNLLVKELGGVKVMNSFARSINDVFFRQDHNWPGEAASGGIGNFYDSSTPDTMQKSFQQLTLGNILAPPQKKLLLTWLRNNTTGDARIRAGVPKGWTVADKTGSGSSYGTTNDIGIIWPPKSSPIIVAIYYTNNQKNAEKREDIVAEVTRILLYEFKNTT